MPTRFPSKRLVVHGEHLLREERSTVAGRLGAHLRAAPALALAGEHPRLVAVGDLAVLPEQVADLAASDADVAGGHVGVLAEVTVELIHERLAEPHHLSIRPAVRIEVRTALAAADALSGEGVLEDLLEAEELDDRQVHRRVETQSALVRAEHRGELDAVAAVHVQTPGIIDPRHPEHDLALRLDQAVEDAAVDVFRMLFEDGGDGVQHLVHGLVELGLVRAAREDRVEDGLDGRCERVENSGGGGHAGSHSEWGMGASDRVA